MQSLVEWLKAWDIVFTAILLPLAGGIMYALGLWEKRMRTRSDLMLQSVEDKITSNSGYARERLERVEGDVQELTSAVVNLQRRVDQLPDGEAITLMRVAIGSMSTKMDQLEGMVNTMYHAAIPRGLGEGMMQGWPILQVEQERRRLQVLLYLAGVPGYRAQAPILRDDCNKQGIPTTKDQIAACVVWLEEMELVTLEEHEPPIARITERGREVAMGQARVPGVMQPDP